MQKFWEGRDPGGKGGSSGNCKIVVPPVASKSSCSQALLIMITLKYCFKD